MKPHALKPAVRPILGFLILALLTLGPRPTAGAGADAAPGSGSFHGRFKIPRAQRPGFPPPRLDPADVVIGERLFLETRFAEYFYAHCRGDVNAALPEGDPAVATLATTGQPLAGPFAGHAMNCRVCHLVNEFNAAGRGHRTYADYARRTPVPARSDGQKTTPRNAPPMVNATVARPVGLFLHFDAEFVSNEDLVKATLTGRNYGWLPDEHSNAVRHIARVIREDDGRGPLAREFGGFAYRTVFAGADPALGAETDRFRITAPYRLEVATATDADVVQAIARLISVYMDSLFFSRDESDAYDGSPYDCFMETNRIPRRPSPGMSETYYNREVIDHLAALRDPVYVTPTNGYRYPLVGRFKTLDQEFRFGPQELAGLRIFFSTPRASAALRNGPAGLASRRGAGAGAGGAVPGDNSRAGRGGIGNCVQCHPAPHFTDFKFHNTGAAQEEYDAVHGAEAFGRLDIPGLPERSADPARWLPPSVAHPRAGGRFLSVPTKDDPGRTDLGLWNVYANADRPAPQAALRRLLQEEQPRATDEALLPRTLGRFKTPSLRGLGFSDPYLHTGRKDTLEDVIEFYRKMAELARAGKVRNGAPELEGIYLQPEDVAPLAAFLRALNEDYE